MNLPKPFSRAAGTFSLIQIFLLTAAMPLAAANEGIQLKKGDKVSINVFEEASLSGSFEVGPDGSIVFPLLGIIDAEGRKAGEVATEIEAKLEDGYIRDAQVVVALSEESILPPHTITVIGQVAAPGQVQFPAGTEMDLFTAVAAAGGIGERGNRDHIELKRKSGSSLRSQYVSLGGNGVLKLHDGDTLIVHAKPIVAVEVATITVIGEVKSPGKLKISREEPLDLIGAIASAGGFTNTARPSKVIVRRNAADGVKAYEFNVSKMQRSNAEPFLLQPGDTITVPESIF